MAAFRFQHAFCAGLAGALLLAGQPARAKDMDTCFDARGTAAIQACTRLIESGKYKRKDLANIYTMRGVQLKIEKEYDRALADYTRAIGIEPSSERYSNRANTRRLKKDIEGALADMGKALDLNPKNASVFSNRGLIWQYEKKDLDRAIEDYSQAIRLESNYTAAYTYRGEAYQEKGDLDHARADYRKAAGLPEGKYTDGRWGKEQARKHLDELAKK